MSVNIVTVNVTQTVGPTPSTLQSTGALVSTGATNTSPGTITLLTQLSDLTAILNGSLAVTSISWAANVATVTTTAAHGLTIGQTYPITIAGSLITAYNGNWLCTVTTTTAFTFTLVVASNPGTASNTGIVWSQEDVSELLAMATTFFAQGANLACYVLELGAASVTQSVANLQTYLNANPNSNYTAGSVGYFYAYVVPREWDGNAAFLALLASYESTTAQTYFFITTTLATYGSYTNLMKCAFTMIESPSYGVYPANVLTAIIYSSVTGYVTATTTTSHNVSVGNWFTISGCTPSGYNGTFQALPGTTGNTLIYAVPANPGAETILGTLQASLYANAGVPSTEFSVVSAFWRLLNYAPSAANLVTPFSFGYVYGVTPFPTRGQNSLLNTLKNSYTNVIGTGAEGGISNTIILWGTTEDGHDFTYWYSVDWVQITSNEMLSNVIINGSNNPQNPLYYDQNGINRLKAAEQTVMNNGIAFGLVLGPVTVNAVPFTTYVTENPTDYPAGIYRGLSVTYTPQRGFTQIVFYVNVTSFPAGG
jgi:hypothetical protein